MNEVQILTLSCPDRAGITASVTGYLYENGGNILEAQQFNDLDSGNFFLRVEFDPGAANQATLRSGSNRWRARIPCGGNSRRATRRARCCCW